MPYTLTIATPATRTLVVESLRGAADQRTRVAKGAARKVAQAKAEGRDVRSQAVKVTALLAEADELTELAAELEAAPEVAVLSVDAAGKLEAIPIPDAVHRYPGDPVTIPAEAVGGIEDDGLSAAAHAAAERAGLTDTVVDEDGPDEDTGATVEDEPLDDSEVEEALK